MINNILEIREEHKSLFEFSLDFLFVYDLRGKIWDANEVVINNLGYSKEEILGMSIFDFLSEEETEKARQGLKSLEVRGKFSNYNIFKIKKKDGSFIFLEVSGIPLKNSMDKIYAFLGIGHDITLLKEAEQNLIKSKEKIRESEEKYRNLFNTSPIGIMIFDSKGNLVDRNDTIITKFPEYLGVEFIGKNFREVINYFKNSNQLLQIFSERYKAFSKGESLRPFGFPVLTKDGRRVWLNWQSSLVKINNESFIQVLIQDITEQKEAEEKFQVLFNNSTSGIAYHKIIYDSEGNPIDYIITDVNPKYEKILSLKKEDVINKKATVAYQVENAPYINNFSKVASTQEPTSFETYFPPMDRHFKISVISLRKGEFITVFDDISEKNRAEQKIRESEEKFRNITEQSFMGITIMQDDIIKYANQAMLDIFGYIIEEVNTWQPLEYLKLFPPEDREIITRYDRYSQDGYDDTVHNYRVRFIKKNEEIGWLELFSNAIKYEGRPAGLISIIDITERLEAEKLIIEENQKLLELHEMRKDIINRVSHELKTPLTSIYGASEILMEKLRDEMSENVLNFMEISYRGAIRLKELVDNLLDSSLLDSKKFELKLNKEDLVKIITEVVNEMTHLAKIRELILETDMPDSLFLNVDKLRLRQAINNIISNAIKNTPTGGTIFINLSEIDGFIDIRVKDTGVGITKKEMEKLFEKFGKIERYGMNLDVDIEGSGLGLYISKEIVELHGGQILVESEGRHKGSTFTIRLLRNT